MRKLLFLVFMGLLVVLAACSSDAQSIADSAANTPQPTAVPSLTPSHTPMPAATFTPAPTETPTVAPTATPPPRLFSFYGDDPSMPIIARGTSGGWDNKYINPGSVFYHDGRFHMFRNGFSNWPGLISVGYMTSEDGYAWTAVQDDPVFTSDQIPYIQSGQGADVSTVLVTDDGAWVMYFHIVSTSKPGVIGRATASSPLGPWQVDPEPVLTPGESSSWDGRDLTYPNVIHTPDGYFMYYGARQLAKDTMIGLATSADGLTWTKYDDPTTTEAPFAESDPIIKSNDVWATGEATRPRVEYTPDGYVMIFQGGAVSLVRRGLAFSDDGIHWMEHPDNPVITRDDFPINGTSWDTSLVYHDDTYYYFMEIGTMAGTDIFLATNQGAIRP